MPNIYTARLRLAIARQAVDNGRVHCPLTLRDHYLQVEREVRHRLEVLDEIADIGPCEMMRRECTEASELGLWVCNMVTRALFGFTFDEQVPWARKDFAEYDEGQDDSDPDEDCWPDYQGAA
jgi:hypothetical protein